MSNNDNTKDAAAQIRSQRTAERNASNRKSLTTIQQQRQDIIAPLFKRGYSYREIRVEVMQRLDLKAYSLQTVKKDIDMLLAEWREERIENVDQNIQLELSRIDDIIKEAWGAWEKSKEDYQKKKMRQDRIPSPDGSGDGKENETKMTLTHASQSTETIVECGDPRYLDVIGRQLQERRKLLGLYAPEKQISVGQQKIAISATESMTMEQMEEELKRLQKLD